MAHTVTLCMPFQFDYYICFPVVVEVSQKGQIICTCMRLGYPKLPNQTP